MLGLEGILLLVAAALVLGGVVVHETRPLPMLGVEIPERVSTPSPSTSAPPTEQPQVTSKRKKTAKKKPQRLCTPVRVIISNKIIKGGMNAPVEPVGLAPDNSQAVPDHAAGWYKLGPKLGAATRNVVIDGHTTLSDDGVLSKLSVVFPGDLISIRCKDGTSRTYKVIERQIVPKVKYDSVKNKVYGTSRSPQRLVLVTCTGKIVGRSHLDSLYIYAVPFENQEDEHVAIRRAR